mgnify:CR=1 FL=1
MGINHGHGHIDDVSAPDPIPRGVFFARVPPGIIGAPQDSIFLRKSGRDSQCVCHDLYLHDPTQDKQGCA